MDEEVTGVEPIPMSPVAPEAIAGVLRRRAAAGDLWVPLEGTSMLPTINAGAEALVVASRRPKWGEVWAFVGPEGSVIVHRVLGCTRNGLWVMRGDGAPGTDPPVGVGSLVGPVEVLRHGGEPYAIGRSRAMALRLHLRRLSGRLRWWIRRLRDRPGG